MSSVRVSHRTKKVNTRLHIPGSKSESNRLLILNALSGNHLKPENLSIARDTQNLVKILVSNDKTVDVMDAGTSMRFLTAFYAATNQHKIITGSERMKERPMLPLINALSELGFDVRSVEKEGFAPLEIVPVKLAKIDSEAFIEGDISSQFITALLMIAPTLPNGLKINFTTPLASRPYVDMTLRMLENFGVSHAWGEDFLEVKHTAFKIPDTAFVSGDWSSASYWYSIVLLAEEADVFIEGLRDDYTQGDRAIADWMKRLGVLTEFKDGGARLTKTKVIYPTLMKMNFRDNPDLAQTFAIMFAAKNICSTFSKLESLRLKETDRIQALKQELRKLNVRFDYSDLYEFYQLKGEFKIPSVPISTYNDHRMAMSFAPLALLGEITIEDPQVVEKSYPGFWNDLKGAGFQID